MFLAGCCCVEFSVHFYEPGVDLLKPAVHLGAQVPDFPAQTVDYTADSAHIITEFTAVAVIRFHALSLTAPNYR